MEDSLFELGHNSVLGRHAMAKRDIKPGELIIKESPLFIGGSITGMHQCFKCYAKITKDVYVCGRCHVATICGIKCTGNGHSRGECDTLKSGGKLKGGDVVKNPQIVLPIRCFLLKSYDCVSWKAFAQLESHLAERRNTPIWSFYNKNVVEIVKELALLTDDEINDELMQKICGILDVNIFEVRPADPLAEDAEPLRGVYLNTSLMAHDCIGNTFLAVDEDYTMTVHAACTIKQGEPIYFNYSNPLMNSSERRKHLKEGKYFDCTCSRCKDGTELGTFMGSVICQKCKVGCLVAENPLTENFENDSFWICNNCMEKCTGKFIEATLAGCRNYIHLHGVESVDKIENTLKRLNTILPQSHSLVLELKQNLIPMLETNRFYPGTFLRKLELCKELAGILKVIEPDTSRLTGIALRELGLTKVAYADSLLNNDNVEPDKYLELMNEAESALKECIRMLVYEPPKSPEGRLLQQALVEMKAIRRSKQDMEKLMAAT